MDSKLMIRSTLTIVAVCLIAGAALAQVTEGPRLTIVEPKKDFGTVAKGEKLSWSFVLKNTGSQDLEITNVQPACGCTVAEYDKVIKAGETGTVHATVNTQTFTGPISKSISIRTNDPDAASAQLMIHAVVRPYVEADPAGFVRYSILQGEVGTEYVTLYSEEDEPFEIVGVELPGEWVKVEYAEASADERTPKGKRGNNQYRVKVTVGGPTAPVGPLVDKITIVTNSQHQPEYELSLSGIIRPAYSVRPTVVNFGDVDSGAGTARTVILSSNHKDAPGSFKVEKVETSQPGLFVAETRETGAGTYEVIVKIRDGAKAGSAKGDLMIYTSDIANPVTTVPMVANIKG